MNAATVRDTRLPVRKLAFHCGLDYQPDYWVPHALRPLKADNPRRTWVVNPNALFSQTGACPFPWISFAQAVRPSGPAIWVMDPVTGVVTPFAVGSRVSGVVQGLRPGERIAASFAPDTIDLLASAGIIYSPEDREAKCSLWKQTIERARGDFAEGYVHLGALLPPCMIGAARVYFRRLIRSGLTFLGDRQTARRRIMHNEPVARFVHHQLVSVVSAVAGTEMKPSYAYFASYEEGAVLGWHVDREQCEVSLSMLIDYFPEPPTESPWPLLLETPDGIVPIYQKLGDSLMYRGRTLRHAREELCSGHTSTHLFLHYVLRDFSGSLD